MPFRTFIAVELAGGVRRRAEKAIQRLRAVNAKVTWVKPENLHLTLKFLGDVPDSDVPKVCQVVADAVRGFDPFEIVFRGCGAFPNTAAPRTIWIGVDQGSDELKAIHQAIDQALKTELRFPRETRRFQAHLTLGRVRESGHRAAELGALIDEMADFDGDLTIVDEIVTFASFLEKSGPVHNPMGYATLAGDATPIARDDDDESDDEDSDDEEVDSEDGDADDGDRESVGGKAAGDEDDRGETARGKKRPKAKSAPRPKTEIPEFDPREFQKLDLGSLNLKGLHLKGTPLFNIPDDVEDSDEPIDDVEISEKLAAEHDPEEDESEADDDADGGDAKVGRGRKPLRPKPRR
ncbi:MAG: RNA 2',3'-cyclic phosphodiesterase [Planctomycetota bacterium]